MLAFLRRTLALVRHERPVGVVAGVAMIAVAVYYLVFVFAVFG